jgi:hypothetical protein
MIESLTSRMLERVNVELKIANLALRSDAADAHLRKLRAYLHRRMERIDDPAEQPEPEGADPTDERDYIKELTDPDLGGSD